VEEPERGETGQENEREPEEPGPAFLRETEREGAREEHGTRAQRAAQRERVAHEERVLERSERPRGERLRAERGPLPDRREEPGDSACLSEEPQCPGARANQPGEHERQGLGSTPLSHEEDRLEEEERSEHQHEMRTHAGSRRREKTGDGSTTRRGGGREHREGEDEEARGGRIGERPSAVHPHDRQEPCEHTAGERFPAAHEAATPNVQRGKKESREERRRDDEALVGPTQSGWRARPRRIHTGSLGLRRGRRGRNA
jgi:hypothetical protein